jgi:putative flippase GtrA
MTALVRLREPVTFSAVGVLNTAVDIGVFALLARLGVPYLAAQAVSYATGACQSYLLNRAVTFRRGGRPTAVEALRFGAVNAASLVISAGVLYAVHGLAHGGLWETKVAATILGAAANYAGNRLWVFAAPVAIGGATRPGRGPRQGVGTLRRAGTGPIAVAAEPAAGARGGVRGARGAPVDRRRRSAGG